MAKTAKTLKQAPRRPAVGHRLGSVGPFTFCGACGAHSCDNTQPLAADCRGHCPKGTIMRGRLDRLLGGCHPRSGVKLPLGAGRAAPTPFGAFAVGAKLVDLEVIPDW